MISDGHGRLAGNGPIGHRLPVSHPRPHRSHRPGAGAHPTGFCRRDHLLAPHQGPVESHAGRCHAILQFVPSRKSSRLQRMDHRRLVLGVRIRSKHSIWKREFNSKWDGRGTSWARPSSDFQDEGNPDRRCSFPVIWVPRTRLSCVDPEAPEPADLVVWNPPTATGLHDQPGTSGSSNWDEVLTRSAGRQRQGLHSGLFPGAHPGIDLRNGPPVLRCRTVRKCFPTCRAGGGPPVFVDSPLGVEITRIYSGLSDLLG